jgi:hypothetical protein
MMPPLPDAIILVLAPCAPRFSERVWVHAHVLLVGAMLSPEPHTVTGALRVMGLSMARHVTNDQRGRNRARWSARHGSRMLLGLLMTLLVPPGATLVLGAEDTGERRSGRTITAKGCYRAPLRSTQKHVIRCFGVQWVSMMLVVPVPWSRRVWAWPFVTALGRPAEKHSRRRPKTSIDWGRQLMKQVRRWRPGRQRVLGGDGGLAAVSLALACVQRRVVMVARWRWDAARYHPPGPQPKGKRGPKPTKGQRQRSWQDGAERTATPWETGEVDWYGGQRQQRWVCARPALWHPPRLRPVAIRYVLVADPEGKLRLAAFFCTDLEAPPEQSLPWVVMRWSVEVTFEEARAHLGLETQRQWSDQAIARPTLVLVALLSFATVRALPLSQDGHMPGPVTAWYHKREPTFSDGLALGRRHLWRARYLVTSAPEAAVMQFPREVLDLLLPGVSLAA